ncbi:MAG: hypothetical protein ABI907_09415, partial [Ramlibacter sp.]
AAQIAIAVLVFAFPRSVHLLDDAVVQASQQAPAASDQDIVRQMEEMARQPAPNAEPEPDAPGAAPAKP